MYICHRDLESVSLLWNQLAEFPITEAEQALAFCLDRLTHIIGAGNVSWTSPIQSEPVAPDDPMRGWWPHAIRVLYDEERHHRQNLALMEHFKSVAVDPQTVAMAETMGTTRVLPRSAVMDDVSWERSWLYQDFLRPLGVLDRMVGSRPVNRVAESYFALDRSNGDAPFDDRSQDLFRLFLAGNPTFHLEQLHARGLIGVTAHLTPREKEVSLLLLTDMSEREIAHKLGLTFHTTHQYIKSIYRKTGVRGRNGLMALRPGLQPDVHYPS